VSVADRAYLDHASSSPLRPAALDAMLPFLRDHHADPGRVHSDGKVTRVAIEDARDAVAAFLHARSREVVFTASGTEAVNAAIYGAVRHRRDVPEGHVVTTAVEHSSVLDAVRREPVDVTVVGVDRHGAFDPEAVAEALRPDTVLVSIQHANHEVGTLQRAAEVAAAVRSARGREVLIHIDACASVGHTGVSFRDLDADLCSVTAHKLGGPKGVAALLVRRGLRVPPFVVGGAQERARRGGLENVPAIVGFGAVAAGLGEPGAVAAEAGQAETLLASARAAVAAVDGTEIYGDPGARLPHVLCFSVAGVEAEPILLGLDQRGVSVHSGSACSSESLEPSPVLAAMGADAEHSLRVSVGWNTAPADVERFAAAFPDVVTRFRSLR
jgi:cysteine desulfurase